MDEIFARAKNLLVIWGDNIDPEHLPRFQQVIQAKADKAQIDYENVQMVVDCQSN